MAGNGLIPCGEVSEPDEAERRGDLSRDFSILVSGTGVANPEPRTHSED